MDPETRVLSPRLLLTLRQLNPEQLYLSFFIYSDISQVRAEEELLAQLLLLLKCVGDTED